MFQGSRNVKSGEHFSALMAEGGRLNATTWFDRTNYFETIPKGALELALWLEADRHGHLLDARHPGEPRQPARRRQGGEAAALRQRALRQRARRRLRHRLPRGTPLPPPDDRVDGGPRRREPRGRPRLLPPLLRAQQLRADHRRRRRAGGRVRQGRDVLRAAAGIGAAAAARRAPPRPAHRAGPARAARGRAQRPAAPRLAAAGRQRRGLPRLLARVRRARRPQHLPARAAPGPRRAVGHRRPRPHHGVRRRGVPRAAHPRRRAPAPTPRPWRRRSSRRSSGSSLEGPDRRRDGVVDRRDRARPG